MNQERREESLEGMLTLGEGSLATALVATLTRIVAFGRARITGASNNSAEPIHEYRKALRRARSIARMLRPSISKRTARRLESALRAAHRQYADARDKDARAATWRAFAEKHRLAITIADHAFSETALNPSRRLSSPIRQEVDTAVQLLAARLPAKMATDELERGLAHTYRSARRALRKAQHVADPQHIHRLRRRCKDLQSQLELLEALAPERAPKLRKRFAKMSKRLGAITDLFVLRRGLDEVWRANPELGPETKRIIDRALDGDITAFVDKALRRAESLLADKPRRFAARLAI